VFAVRQRQSELRVGAYQRVPREASVEAARIGKHPGFGSGECDLLWAPVDVGGAGHRREGQLSQEGCRPRPIPTDFCFEAWPCLPELLGRDLVCLPGRPRHNRGDSTAKLQQLLFVFGPQLPIGEAGEMQHRPEPVVAVREVMPVDGGAVRRIDAAKDHVETLGEDVGGVSGHRISQKM